MPQLNLVEALRFFFAPFVALACYCAFDPTTAEQMAKKFGSIPTIAALIAGVTFYWAYRYWFHDRFVMSLYDQWRYWLGHDNHRLFIVRRYSIPIKFISSTTLANRVIHELATNKEYSDEMQKRQRPMRASSVHLLYQSAIVTFLFSILAVTRSYWLLTAVLFTACVVQVITAMGLDFEYEDEELLVVQSTLEKLDTAAAKLELTGPSVSC